MHVVTAVVLLIFSSAVSATNILLSNDDGWAEANIRAFYDALTLTGHSVVLSAPAENKSGSGKVSNKRTAKDCRSNLIL